MKNIYLKVGNFLVNNNILLYMSVLSVAFLGVAVYQKHGCQGNKSQATCTMISTTHEPNQEPNTPVPGIAYILPNTNTPTGSKIGPSGMWGSKGTDQVVLTFTLLSWGGPLCKKPDVTGFIMEVDLKMSPFVVGQTFTLFVKLDDHLIETAAGRITSDGKLNMNFLEPQRLGENGVWDRYFELRLDTSNAQPGDLLFIRRAIVEYEVNGQKFRSHQPRFSSVIEY